jgi:trehalose/maltose transport system substrate-binding protein
MHSPPGTESRARIRTVLAWACALLAALWLPAPRAEPAVTLVFKHAKLFGDPAAFARLIGEFERANPGIRVVQQALPSSSDAQHQFYAINLQARSRAFDVLALDVIWVAEFARAGWLRDLSGLLPPDAHAAFFRGPMQAVTYEGRVYAIPWFIDAGLLYYRKDLLAREGFPPPETWEQLVHIAQSVAAKERPAHRRRFYGFVWQGKQYEGLVCNALEYFWSNGGGVLRDGQVELDRPQNVQALGFMRDLVAEYHVTPDFVTTDTEEPSRRIFGSGRAVFLRNWPYAWSLFERPGSPVRGKVGVAVLPHFPGHASAAALGGWQLGVNAFSRHPRAAERLVAFLTSPAAQRALALAYGLNPTRRALYRDPALLEAQPFLGRLEAVFEHARPRPVTPYYIMISQVLQSELSAALAGMRSPQAALEQAQRQVEAILARGG